MKIVSGIKQNKTEVTEILILAIGLSTGVNLLSTYMGNVIDINVVAVIGICILAISIIYIVFLKRPNTSTTLKTSAVLSVNSKTNELAKIDDYDYNYEFMTCLSSLFRENKLYKEQWTKDPIGRHFNGKDVSSEEFDKSRNRKLIKEITEYIYLRYLSMHLSEYFENGPYNKKFLTNLSRKDASEIIMSNRVLDLLTKKLDDRVKTGKKDVVIEITRTEDDEPPELIEKIVNGIIYTKFDLILPKNSKIKRNEDGSVSISNKSIALSFTVKQDGVNSFVDSMFERYYMRHKQPYKPFNLNHYKVEIETQIAIKPSLIAFGKRTEYHRWADSFLSKIDNRMSFSKFLKQINWQTAKTLHYMQRNEIISNSINKNISPSANISKT